MIKKAMDEDITQKEAADLCGLSERQIRRIISKIKIGGDRAIIHGSRGKPSHAGTPQKLKQKIIALYKSKYSDFGLTLAQEKLLENHKINISHETLRIWLQKEEFIHCRTRKKKPNRIRRQRKECFGQMVQMDGSHHDWLEGRGPWLVLMGYIDDATSNVYAEFHDYEGTMPAMASFYRYVLKYGLPGSVYLDKHSTYKVNQEPSIEDQLKGEKFRTQYQRALESLGVEVIHAHSPQAKGRVERLFDTFQDRLVKELRLEGAKTKEEANTIMRTYLPKFNRKFKRAPKNRADLHQRPPSYVKLKRILAIHHDASLANDNTIRSEGKIYLIKDRLTNNRTKKIRVEERMDMKIYLMDKDRSLQYKEINEPVRLVQEKPKKPRKSKTVFIPPKDHPLKRFVISRNSLIRSTKNGFLRPDTLHLKGRLKTIEDTDTSNHHTQESDLSTYPSYPQRKRKKESKKEKEMATATAD